MNTITLESIKAEQTRLASLIAAFEAQAETEIHFPEALIALQPGEHYAGLIVGKDGEPSHHLILLPGQADDINWEKAVAWAQNQGGEYVGDLPSRREQALLYANLKDQFEDRNYWSSEQDASDSSYAWCQYFNIGNQYDDHKDDELRARAVRRLIIE